MATVTALTIPDFRGHSAGKDFERELLEAIRLSDRITGSRYGVQASIIDGEWRPKPSLPDLEGILCGSGRQWITDCKVCSGASFSLAKFEEESHGKHGNTRRQLEHMIHRADRGALCFFAVHFNSRQMKTKSEQATTHLIPVLSYHDIWDEFFRGERASISRAHCEHYGLTVAWTVPKGKKKLRPAIESAILELSNAY